MASQPRPTRGSRVGRALRMGKRIGERAAELLKGTRRTSSPIPETPVDVIFELAAGRRDAIRGKAAGGSSLLAAAQSLGIDLNHYCGGLCSCGTCRIEVLAGDDNLSRREGLEEMVLGTSHVAAGNRLACQALVLGPVRVRIPEWF